MPRLAHSSQLKGTFKIQICTGDEKLVLCVLYTVDSSRLGDLSFVVVFLSTSQTPGHYAKLGDQCFISVPRLLLIGHIIWCLEICNIEGAINKPIIIKSRYMCVV
jgi:hypothetical protein